MRTFRRSPVLMLAFIPFALYSILGNAFPFARGCSVASSLSSYTHNTKISNSETIDVSFESDKSDLHVAQPKTTKNLVAIENIIGRTKLPMPNSKTNLLQKITFGWVRELLDKGNKRSNNKPLELDDIWKLDSNDQMESVSSRFEEFYKTELLSTRNITKSINQRNILLEFWSYPETRAIIKMFKNEFILTGILKAANTFVQFFPSLIIARILSLVSSSGVNSSIKSKLYIAQGFKLSLLLFSTLMMKTLLENTYFSHVINMAASVRGALSTAIYKKSFRLNPQGRQNFTIGEISNYLQLDTNRMEQAAGSIHTIWDGMLQIIGYTSLLLAFLGPSVFAGIAALLVIIPLNAYYLNELSKQRALNMKMTDNRVKLTSEILQGIRAIKSYNWEKPFLFELNRIREAEIKALKTAANIRAILVSILSAAPSFVAVVTLALYAWLGNELNPTKVFTSLALFNQLRFPIIFFPLLLNTLTDGKISVKRISGFLSSPEVQNYVSNPSLKSNQELNSISNDLNLGKIEIVGGDFTWATSLPTSNKTDVSSPRGRLKGINIHIQPGELVAVVGPVGSGKSMLIASLLGELSRREGFVGVNGRIAYVPQTAWIPNDSLRNVILFGRPYNERQYVSAIQSCGLVKDITNLDAGDETEIGERGVNLSGGQKQRVSIARAVYDDADIYLLDDPLSALDADVGQSVFNDCIKGVLSKKTRILVTHQLRVLPQVDRIILMHSLPDGSCEILDQGSLNELYSRGYDLSKLVKPSTTKEQSEKTNAGSNQENAVTAKTTAYDISTQENEGTDNIFSVSDNSERKHQLDSLSSSMVDCCYSSDGTAIPCPIDDTLLPPTKLSMEETKVAHEVIRRRLPGASLPLPNPNILKNMNNKSVKNFSNDSIGKESIQKKPVSKLVSAEERGEGAVGWPVYKKYISAAKSPLLVFAIFASFAIANFAQIGQLWVVSAWTSDIGYAKYPMAVYMAGITMMAIAVAFFNWSRTFMAYIVGANSSKELHFQMMKRVLSAPLSFFESTPLGRLMQRFSKDLDSMDQQLPGSFGQMIASALSIAGAMVAVCLVTPSFVLVMLPVFTIYFFLTNYYRKVARDLKRLDSISRSPIYVHFSETLNGLSVIRSFQRQHLFQRINEVKIDDNLSAYYALKAVDRWLSLRLEFLGNTMVFFSSLLAIMSGSKAGITGISLNNALSITSLLNWAVRNGAETESLMNSVERVLYTATNTPTELSTNLNASTLTVEYRQINDQSNHLIGTQTKTNKNYISESELISSGWPWKGGIVFDNVIMSYRDDFDPVLKGVNLSIQPGERIGVVGRTGSGKSSLFRALLRLTEIDSSGAIYIDGVNLKTISMETLRMAVSIIPQDPVLFSGSLRFNLDPFHMRSDEELWTALKKANLESTVRSLPGQLHFQVSEGGENFSAGQRQLICLARALVRKSKLLLLDEATSSIDIDTDILIQKAIREEFSELSSTVLTIAHRLGTIIDADKILVMDNGKVAEFDTPMNLLKNPNSIFTQLINIENKGKNFNDMKSMDRNQTILNASYDIELNRKSNQSSILNRS